MRYNFISIGNRLTELRKSKKLSQDNLLAILKENYDIGLSRKTLSNIENGLQPGANISIDLLSALSDLYDCEIGYLLCEYDCKTGRNTDISLETGLSDESIQGLRYYNGVSNKMTDNRPTYIELLNLFIETGSLDHILECFRNFIALDYKVPVYFDIHENSYIVPPNSVGVSIVSNGNSEELVESSYKLTLAKDAGKPNKNISFSVSDSLMETAQLKELEKTFYKLRDTYNSKNK